MDITKQMARVFKALGHPARLEIVSYIVDNDKEGAGVQFGEIVKFANPAGLCQSSMSQHMKTLVKAGVLKQVRTKTHPWRHSGTWYSFNEDLTLDAIRDLASIIRHTAGFCKWPSNMEF